MHISSELPEREREKVPKWVITAMSLIGEKVIGFEDQAEVTSVPVVEIESGPNLGLCRRTEERA